jgi:GNAT superfamily N-acetyltransferase
MDVTFRPATLDDASNAGRVCYEAFRSIAERHGFPPDFPSPDAATAVLRMLIRTPGVYGVIAERSGRILGSNFIDERSPIRGIGPISVDPAIQDRGLGRRLMRVVLDRAGEDAAGVRLIQAAYNTRSLSLYTRLGFRTREPLSVLQGPPLRIAFPGHAVRPALEADIDACNALCHEIHGLDRDAEVRSAIARSTATVVEHLGSITGYATLTGFFGHAVARSNQDLMALIAAAPKFPGPGFLLPTRNHEVFAWCLSQGLKLVMQATLMSVGLYNEPAGAYLPSVLY